jgi:hypothetical protein
MVVVDGVDPSSLVLRTSAKPLSYTTLEEGGGVEPRAQSRPFQLAVGPTTTRGTPSRTPRSTVPRPRRSQAGSAAAAPGETEHITRSVTWSDPKNGGERWNRTTRRSNERCGKRNATSRRDLHGLYSLPWCPGRESNPQQAVPVGDLQEPRPNGATRASRSPVKPAGRAHR